MHMIMIFKMYPHTYDNIYTMIQLNMSKTVAASAMFVLANQIQVHVHVLDFMLI